MTATNTLTGEHVRNRPTMRDLGIYRRAAEILFERMDDYGIERDDDATPEAVLRDIEKAIAYGRGGYERARSMERSGWMPDAAMVECLDDNAEYDALREAIREWVQTEGIVASLAIGTAVQISHANDADKSPAAGVIIGIDESQATYTVRVPAWGHVEKGNGAYGIILAFEVVESAQTVNAVPNPPDQPASPSAR